ncbi:MAG TPA: tetratricopeptide repeat protein, partial [Armatimonadota bacterium]
MILVFVLSLVGCSRRAHLRPEEVFADARAKFERGELVQALETSETGLQQFGQSQSIWRLRFNVLKAEILIWQGKSKESLDLLDEHQPTNYASDEAAVRRKIIQSVDLYYLQRFDEAVESLSEAEQLATTSQPQLLGEIASVKGRFAVVHRDFPEGQKLFSEALQIARTQNQHFLEVNALGNLGWSAMLQQHYDEAVDWFGAASTAAQRIGNATQRVRILGNLGWCYYKLGDYERSSSIYEESQKLAEKLGLLNDQQLRLNNIGLIRYQQRDFRGAEESYNRALEISRKLENKSASSMALNNLAAVALESKQYDVSEQHNREAIELERSSSDKTAIFESLINKGRIAAGRKQYPEAEKSFQQVIDDSGE